MASPRIKSDPELRIALERLFSLQTFGIKLGLGPVTALLEEYGNPQRSFPAIHIAGTNGKGSVCAMIASALQASGLRVGLYSSPHLVGFDERIRINGEPIGQECLGNYAREMLPAIERLGCTFFEGTTAMGFRYFAEMNVDVAVIETGLGGRLDATNILEPIAAAVTSIGFDHMKHLGGTLEEIAREKGGIFKSGTIAIVGHVLPRLREVFMEQARDFEAMLRFTDDFCRGLYRSMDFDGTFASFIIDGRELPDLQIDLVGRHQIDNAAVALGVLDSLPKPFTLDEATLREGFANIRRNTAIRGRLESVRVAPRVVLDVAHNPDGARVLVDSLTALGARNRNVHIVYGAVEDKDVPGVIESFKPIASRLYAVRADNHRSLPTEEILFQSARAEIPTVSAGSVANGMDAALNEASTDDLIVVCGSFYVVADAITYLEASDEGQAYEVQERMATDTSDTYDSQEASGTSPKESGEELEALSSGKRATVKEWSPSEQPRERLMKLGAGALSDAELLAILLRTGTAKEDVIQVGRNIIQRFGNFTQLAERDYKELEQISGVGPAKAVSLAAAFEIGRRIESDPFASRPTISSPEDVARIFVPKLRGIKKEQFHVIILNSANQIIRMDLVSEGNLNSSIVHPREVFRVAIIENAAAIIGLHNHPSGNPNASKEDIAVTRQLVESGRIIGIPFHDHIIIAGDEFISLAEKGYV